MHCTRLMAMMGRPARPDCVKPEGSGGNHGCEKQERTQEREKKRWKVLTDSV